MTKLIGFLKSLFYFAGLLLGRITTRLRLLIWGPAHTDAIVHHLQEVVMALKMHSANVAGEMEHVYQHEVDYLEHASEAVEDALKAALHLRPDLLPDKDEAPEDAHEANAVTPAPKAGDGNATNH